MARNTSQSLAYFPKGAATEKSHPFDFAQCRLLCKKRERLGHRAAKAGTILSDLRYA